MASVAADFAFCQRSPYSMLYEVSTRMTASRAPFCVAAASSDRLKKGRAKASTMSASAASRISEQQPVADAPPPDRLVRNLAQEHQRRELDHTLPLALNQMNQHGNGERAKADEHQRCDKSHLTTNCRLRTI